MIDFLKMNVSYLSESELLNNSLIEWKRPVNPNTAETGYPIKGKYFNLDAKINPTRKEISGSIHKLRNEIKTSQNQNYDDFNCMDIESMIRHLIDKFDLVPETTIIENLEIGLNIITNKEPEKILNENLIVWNYKEPSTNTDYNGNGKFIEFETSQYYFKIYDKGKQYNTGTNIIRIECKIKRNETLKKIGLSSLQDLTDKAKITALLDFLYQSFTNTLIIDNDPLKQITDPKEKEIIKDGTNPKHWTSLKGMQRKRFKDKFDTIIEKYDLNQIYKEIETKLKTKGKQLLECYGMNDFQNIQSNSQNNEMLRNEPYIYIHNVTVRKCKITGIDITHQKSESKFLSMASIKRIFETEPETFKTLLGNFSPKGPETMDFDKLCLEIAHNIRNRDSNKRHEIKKKTELYRNSFFPLDINTTIANNNNFQYGI